MKRNAVLWLAWAVLVVAISAGCATTDGRASSEQVSSEATPVEHVVSIVATDGGDVDPENSVRVEDGERLMIAAVPEPGYVVDYVTIDGVRDPDSSYWIDLNPVTKDTSVLVSFRPERVCLVLSVGGAQGLAHIGAIEAFAEAGYTFDCVFGNSMGAIVGGLYASAPQEPLTDRYRKFMTSYVAETTAEIQDGAIEGGLLAGVAALFLSGGTLGWGTIGAAIAGGAIGASGPAELDPARLASVLDRYFEGAEIADLPLPFATSYFARNDIGLDYIVADSGSLATAVSRSANNPYVFEETKLDFVDPGVDRLSAVPVEQAAEVFSPDTIIAINTTGEPAIYDSGLEAVVYEVMVPNVPDVELRSALLAEGEDFERLYTAGYTAASQFVARRTQR